MNSQCFPDNQLDSMDVLYAINTKKEPAVQNAPRFANESLLSVTDSNISIRNLLEVVKNEKIANSVLSEDVIQKLGIDRIEDGNITPSLIYSTRDNVPSAYELLGKTKQLEKRNLKLQEDIVRLQKLVKLQSKVTHGKMFTDSSLINAAKQIAKLGNSKIDIKHLKAELSELYIVNGKDVLWEDVMSKAHSIAQNVLAEAREVRVADEYMQEVLKGMHNKPLKLTESQKAEIEFATGQKWNKAIFGKFKYFENGVPLDSWWPL